jgi:FHA domain-containing protein
VFQLIVLTIRGAAPAQPLAAAFGPAGGTVGRAATNTLVLDDPDRTVSRVHAQVLCRSGAFFAVDRGSNPMQHNGRPVGSGNEVALADGDRLVVGSFELQVQAAPAGAGWGTGQGAEAKAAALPVDDDPFADLLAGIAPAASPPSSRAAAPADPLFFPDPLGGTPGRAPADDPFADLLGSSGPAPAAKQASLPSSPSSASAHAVALDDFSDLGLPAAGKGGGIDDLFGGVGAGGLGGDPLALSPLAGPMVQPNTAASADPFAALQASARPAGPSSRGDHLPMGQFAYVPPPAAAPGPAPGAPFASVPGPAAGAAPLFDDVTGRPIAAGASALPPADFGFDEVPAPLHDSDFDDLPAPPVPSAPRAAAPSAAAAPPAPALASASASTAPHASDDELLAALLRGLASNHQPPEMLTPGLMERIGVALRAATEGTLQLLLTRQEFKREVRAEVTMIASKANNPLKFSPTVEIALSHLLGPAMRGFMPPEAAMRDAYDDLRAHQFGVMVGMRAALAHVIARFEPAELEKKISAKSALDSLFAANRKARLWDQFVALYAGIAAEAEDDFHSLFGKAFVKAYEEQMERFKAEK